MRGVASASATAQHVALRIEAFCTKRFSVGTPSTRLRRTSPSSSLQNASLDLIYRRALWRADATLFHRAPVPTPLSGTALLPRCAALAIAAFSLLAQGCSKKPARGAKPASSDAVQLPATAIGDFKGSLLKAEGGVAKIAFANVTARVSATRNRYLVQFLGGTPAVPADVAPIGRLMFVERPGALGVYHSIARGGSVEGVIISISFKPNINIDRPFGAGTLAFVGVK